MDGDMIELTKIETRVYWISILISEGDQIQISSDVPSREKVLEYLETALVKLRERL